MTQSSHQNDRLAWRPDATPFARLTVLPSRIVSDIAPRSRYRLPARTSGPDAHPRFGVDEFKQPDIVVRR